MNEEKCNDCQGFGSVCLILPNTPYPQSFETGTKVFCPKCEGSGVSNRKGVSDSIPFLFSSYDLKQSYWPEAWTINGLEQLKALNNDPPIIIATDMNDDPDPRGILINQIKGPGQVIISQVRNGRSTINNNK